MDGKRLTCGKGEQWTERNVVEVVAFPGGKVLFSAKLPDLTWCNAILSGDGKRLATWGRLRDTTEKGGRSFRIWDVETGKEIDKLEGIDNSLTKPAFSPDGRYLAAGGNGGTIVWDLKTGQVVRRLLSGRFPLCYSVRTARRLAPLKEALLQQTPCLVFSPDRRLLAAATQSEGKEDGRLVVWETASGSVRQVFRPGQHISCLACSWDSQVLASGAVGGSILLWDLPDRAARSASGEKFSPEQAAELWTDLAAADAGKAFGAMTRLLRNPGPTLALLREKLPPVREKPAAAELEPFPFRIGDPAILRQVRAVEVVERIAAAESRELLRLWATGQAGARLTQEADWALKRLSR